MKERAILAVLPAGRSRGPKQLDFLSKRTHVARNGAAAAIHTTPVLRPTAVPATASREPAGVEATSSISGISASFQRAKDMVRHGAAAASLARRTFSGDDDASPGKDENTVFVWAGDSKYSGTAANWTDAVAEAESVVHPKGGSVINPRNLLGADLSIITSQIRRLLGSGHPVLNTVSSYYFQQQGKHVRPLIVLLMSMATSLAPKSASLNIFDEATIDRPLAGNKQISYSPADPKASSGASSPLLATTAVPDLSLPHILPSQRRLAEITEMIHTASLLHDDVIDESPTRRSQPSANAAFGNKMAILAGDFLLARASVALARLRDVEVVELLATVISNLVEGEFMQLRNSQAADAEGKSLDRFQYYMEKTYLKTASLIAKSCRASAVLGGCGADVIEQAYEYGRSIGLAFQVGRACFGSAYGLA